jgi:hypothetical protein
LEHDVIEDLWGHVFRSGHGELLKVGKKEAGTKIDQFELLNVRAFCFKFSLDLNQNILGLEV